MKLYELRKPTRPILYGLLLILTTTATLVFSLQTLLDGLMLDHARGEYAYVVTPYPYDSESPLLEPVAQEVIDLMMACDHVTGFQKQDIRAGRLWDIAPIPDSMLTRDSLVQHYIVEGTLNKNHDTFRSGEWPEGVVMDTFTFWTTDESFRSWGAWRLGGKDLRFTVNFFRMEDELADEYGMSILKDGDHILVMSDFVTSDVYVKSDIGVAYTTAARQAFGLEGSDSLLREQGIFLLPKDQNILKETGEVDWTATMPKAEAYFLEQLEQAGILPVLEKYRSFESAVTVRYVSDMSLIPNMAKGTMYTDWGRQLHESDHGKKVCMVSQGLMQRNHLAVGDTITISIAEDGYTIGETREGAGWESGLPMEEDEILPYGPPEEYTIVGFYHQLGRKFNDPSYLGINDILIPKAQEDITGQISRAYTLSFRVPGEGYDAFYAETKEQLEALGYGMQIIDNGWEDVADSFYTMYDRRVLTCICAMLCFLTAALSFGGLMFYHYRREYGLCRLQGAYKREARRVFWKGFGLSGLPASLIAIVCSWVVYILWLRQKVYEAIPLTMPSDPECLELLLLWTLAELLVAAVFQRILIARSEKRGILRML